MPRIEHPEFGPVNERTFPAVGLDAGLRGSLDDFKNRGLICDFDLEKETFTLWRPWTEGQPPDEFFRSFSKSDRIAYSHHLFRRVQRKLDELGSSHGALHPRNIILRQGGVFELVDAVFNRVLMAPLTVPQDDPWLWGPCVPKGWTLKDWDRVSLLRTVALLAQDPDVWEKPLPTEQSAEMCRKWADALIQSAPAGADFIPVVREAVALLPALLDATFGLQPEALPVKQTELIEIVESRKGKTGAEGATETPDQSYISTETGRREMSGTLAAVAQVGGLETSRKVLPPQENREQITIEGAMAFPLSERLKKAIHRNRGLQRACKFVMWVSGGIISLVLAFYGGVFAEHNRDLKSVLWRLGEAQELKLSQLMTDPRPKREVVYIFALDVSGSLLEERASNGDVIHLQERASAGGLNDGFDGQEMTANCGFSAPGLARWHLARAQTCSYLHTIEDGARAGLWKFSRSTRLVSDYKGERFDKSESNLEVDARKRLVQKLMEQSVEPRPTDPEHQTTDFESLFNTMHEEYIASREFKDMELRFVIISDFIHDVGASDRAAYATSRRNIALKLDEIKAASNATFHLMVIGPGNQENSILGMIEDHLDQFRVDFFDHPDAANVPDFLYGFSSASRDLVFYYPAGTMIVEPVILVWDEGMPKKDNSPLLIKLMPDEDEASDDDLAIHVAERRPLYTAEGRIERACPRRQSSDNGPVAAAQQLKEAVLHSKGVQDFIIRRPGDYICLRPNSPEKERTYSFKLIFSCAEGHAGKNSYVVNVRFQRYLPEMVSVILALCAVAIIFSLVYYIVALIAALFQTREGSQREGQG